MLTWGAVLVPLAIAIAWAALSWPEAARQARAEAEVNATLVQQYVQRVLQSEENLIAHLSTLLAEVDLSEVERDAANSYLQQLVSAFEFTKFVAIASPEGELLFTGGEGFDVIEENRDRLAAMTASPDTGLHVDRWLDARGTDVLVIYSRENNLVAAVDIEVILDFLAETTTVVQSSAALVRNDGRILIRYSNPEGLAPPYDVALTAPPLSAFAQNDTGAFDATSTLDDRARLFGFARIGETPIYATFGYPRSFVAAGWVADVAPITALLLLASALALFGIRQSARSVELAQQRQRLEFDRRALVEAEKRANEHEVLLKELHHRTKNNLQAIQSLIALRLNSSVAEREAFAAIQQRVWAIAEVHDLLYSSDNLRNLSLTEFLRAACRNAALIPPEKHIAVTCKADEVDIEIHQAVPVALVVVELITNATKHAYSGVADPRLLVRLRRDGDCVELTISDNGVGLPHDARAGAGVSGLRMVEALLVQFGGKMHVEAGEGTTYRVSFPLALADPASVH
ncbi:MAG: sensor histidine kinase [Bauldia sp.]